MYCSKSTTYRKQSAIIKSLSLSKFVWLRQNATPILILERILLSERIGSDNNNNKENGAELYGNTAHEKGKTTTLGKSQGVFGEHFGFFLI